MSLVLPLFDVPVVESGFGWSSWNETARLISGTDGTGRRGSLEPVKERLHAFVDRYTPGVFAGLSLVVGVLAGLGGALMIEAIGWVSSAALWVQDAFAGERFLPLITVPLGLFVAWALSQRLPELRGSGVPVTTAGLAVRSGYIPTRASYLKILATAVTLGMGGSAGREGPTVLVGASIGSSIGRYSGLGEDQVRSLVAAGAGAGIGATFNAPIAGMLFSMEVILGNFAIRHLNAVVIASVSAAVTTRTIVGEDRILSVPSHGLGHPSEIGLYAVLGLLAAGVGYLFLKAFDSVHTEIALFERRPWLRPLVLGVPVAVIVTLEPRVLGTGQGFIQSIVGGGALDIAWWVFFVLIGLKILATAGTLGSHASGGHFMPALFIGSTLGAGFGDFVRQFWGFSDLDTGAFAVVGMAAVFAAVARAPLTSILIVLVRDEAEQPLDHERQQRQRGHDPYAIRVDASRIHVPFEEIELICLDDALDEIERPEHGEQLSAIEVYVQSSLPSRPQLRSGDLIALSR